MTLEEIRKWLAMIGGVLVALAAAFGVTEFVQPSETVRLIIMGVAMLVLAYFNSRKA